MSNIFDITGKVILFTGGYGWLGTATTAYFSQHGAKVYILARSREKFEETFGSNGNIFFERCDLESISEIKECVAKINSTEGRIDVLINNGFYSKNGSPEDMSDKDFSIGIDGTLSSVFRFIREVIPVFKSQGFGKIINVSSMYGVVAPDFKLYDSSPEFLNPPNYGAAKAGVIQLTKYYASYLGRYNVQVNCISPGPFPSRVVKEIDPGFEIKLSRMTFLNRVGIPEDLIGVFVLLASSASNYITGQNIVVDGGWTSK